jgi:hypothetical protein
MTNDCGLAMRGAPAAEAGRRVSRVQNETLFMESGVGLIGCEGGPIGHPFSQACANDKDEVIRAQVLFINELHPV